MKSREIEEVSSGAKGVFSDERLFDKKEFSFMRSGKSGGYAERFSAAQISQLMARFEPAMKKIGYV